MNEAASSAESPRSVLLALAAIVLLYAGTALLGWPQLGTELTNGAHDAADEGGDAPPFHPGAPEEGAAEVGAAAAPEVHKPDPPPYLMVAPFVLLLGAIAVFPLWGKTAHAWEHNSTKFYVAGGLGVVTLLYYAFFHAAPVERHFLGHAVVERAGAVDWGSPWTLIQNAIFNDYVPFMVLLFSLYTICGGIRIEGDLTAEPKTNVAFLATGAALASFIGTTGAAMLLIRPLLETNRERKHVTHTVVFFIFLVCNCGGLLLPIGDPPLFLGYLQGVPFLWTLSLWKPWLAVNGALLLIYYLWDRFYAHPRETKADLAADERRVTQLRTQGAGLNGVLLLGVVLATALLSPSRPFPGTHWYPWLYLREVVQLALVGTSLALGKPEVRTRNRFNYGAIVEVAALFIGIFLCMQPALQILGVKGASLGLNTPTEFFWVTGALSSVLDNAPTYLVFFETARALPAEGEAISGVAVHLLSAISLGAVMMGANTYIGNGPNFMVKTIAESSGVKMPSFFGYVVYSGCVLIPLFVLVTFLFC